MLTKKSLMRYRWRTALVGLVLIGGASALWAKQQDPFRVSVPLLRSQTAARVPSLPPPTRGVYANDSDVLKGLKGVRIDVVIQELDDQSKKTGLMKDQIHSATELSLRRNGLQVITDKDEWMATPGRPVLRVQISLIRNVFSINVILKENVRLDRDTDTIVGGATTWTDGGLGGIGVDGTDLIIKGVEQCADKFCLDYLKANPK